jgi:hypothetical protein
MATCEPATDVFVEIWACNAQGVYSAFSGAPGGAGGNGTTNTTESISATGASPSASGTASMPIPSGGGGGGRGSSSKANGENFLRGGVIANENGVAELAVRSFTPTLISNNLTISFLRPSSPDIVSLSPPTPLIEV